MPLELFAQEIPQQVLADLTIAAQSACAGTRWDLKGSRYGAAVLTASSTIYPGKNWFSPSLVGSVHAEQSALIHAHVHDDPIVWAIAIASNDESVEPVPCGICRQLLFENARHSRVDIRIITVNDTHRCSYTISELYPNPWPARPPRSSEG
jgi:cytidine deaminase